MNTDEFIAKLKPEYDNIYKVIKNINEFDNSAVVIRNEVKNYDNKIKPIMIVYNIDTKYKQQLINAVKNNKVFFGDKNKVRTPYALNKISLAYFCKKWDWYGLVVAKILFFHAFDCDIIDDTDKYGLILLLFILEEYFDELIQKCAAVKDKKSEIHILSNPLKYMNINVVKALKNGYNHYKMAIKANIKNRILLFFAAFLCLDETDDNIMARIIDFNIHQYTQDITAELNEYLILEKITLLLVVNIV